MFLSAGLPQPKVYAVSADFLTIRPDDSPGIKRLKKLAALDTVQQEDLPDDLNPNSRIGNYGKIMHQKKRVKCESYLRLIHTVLRLFQQATEAGMRFRTAQSKGNSLWPLGGKRCDLAENLFQGGSIQPVFRLAMRQCRIKGRTCKKPFFQHHLGEKSLYRI